MSCVVATTFSSIAFLSSSVSMAYLSSLLAASFSGLALLPSLSSLLAASFSGLALLSSSVSTANLSCLLETTFSSLSFLSNSFSSPPFNLLRVAKRCFSWSSVSFLLYLFCVLSSAFLSSVLQSLKLCLL